MSWMDDIDSVQVSTRAEPLPIGAHDVTLLSVREHYSRTGSIGVLVKVELDGGKYSFRIQLGGKFPEYGAREVKSLCAALMGISDPQRINSEITKAVTASILSEDQPCRGRRFRAVVTEDEKCDAQGRPYRRVRTYALDDTQSGETALPPSAPPIPPSWPPAGWQRHPQSDQHFFKGSQVLTESELRALVAVGKAA